MAGIRYKGQIFSGAASFANPIQWEANGEFRISGAFIGVIQ